jgi:hypothetical protein
MIIKLVALVLPLGLDTLVVAAALREGSEAPPAGARSPWA